MTEPDELIVQVARAVERGQRGERDDARRLLNQLWDRVGGAGDALHRVAVAHAMADLQDDPHDELTWDLRALHSADSLSDERAARAGGYGPVAGFYPSLHLNLAEDCRKLGDLAAARRHLAEGREASRHLGDGAYADMVRGGLEGLAERLTAT